MCSSLADVQDYYLLGLDLSKRVALMGTAMWGGCSHRRQGAGTSSPSLGKGKEQDRHSKQAVLIFSLRARLLEAALLQKTVLATAP